MITGITGERGLLPAALRSQLKMGSQRRMVAGPDGREASLRVMKPQATDVAIHERQRRGLLHYRPQRRMAHTSRK